MTLSYAIISACLAFGCGLASRIEGGSPPRFDKLISQTVVMLPVIAFGFAVSVQGGLASMIGFVGRMIGHGQYFLHRGVKPLEPERVDFIVSLFFGHDPRGKTMALLRGIDEADVPAVERVLIQEAMRHYGMKKLYARCAFGMALTGLLVTLPLAVVLMGMGMFGIAGIVALAGLSKSVGYMIGYEIERHGFNKYFPEHLRGGTEIGEFLEAILMVLILSVAFWGFSHGVLISV